MVYALDFEVLLKQYEPLLRGMARRYANRSNEYKDLYQEACIGLWQAILHYDKQKEKAGLNSFRGYIKKYVRGTILNKIRDHRGLIKYPRKVRGDYFYIDTVDRQVYSYDDSLHDQVFIKDIIPAPEDDWEAFIDMKDALKRVSDRRGKIALIRDAQGYPQRLIAAELSCSQMHASRILRKAREELAAA